MIVHIILVTGERVDIRYLSLLKYNAGSGEKEIRTLNKIKPHWKEVAIQLDLTPESIEIWSDNDPKDATYNMITEWIRTDPDNCWRKLVQKMKDAELLTPAADLAHALHHMTAQ